MADEASDRSGEGSLEGRLTAEQVKAEREAIESRPGDIKPGEAGKRAKPEPILKEWLELLLRAAVWALLIYQFVFQVSVVNGHSMQPNFEHGDRLLIDKVTYRFRDPQPGEAIVFEAFVDEAGRRVPRDYIKRVVAGPGDVIEIFDGVVHVNDAALDESWGPLGFGGREADPKSVLTEAYMLPADRYFVLGDNRAEGGSEDSRRAKIGFVHRNQIKGKVRWRFFPFGRWSWY